MTVPSTPTVRSVNVPGARLHYEIRGSGPLVLVAGSPMASAEFAPLADALAVDHTVVTFDPRGYADSPVEEQEAASTVEQRAGDVIAILDDLQAESADVFGSSGGAVTGLALVARHPGRVRTLVAHEPPLLELLPDAAEQREATEAIIDTFHRHGFGAAWMHFMRNAGFDVSPGDAPPEPAEPSDDDIRQSARFFEIDLRPTTRFVPDFDALTSSPAHVVIGVGVDSRQLLTYRTSIAVAELLGVAPVEFPGDHGGFMGAPMEFADTLRTVLG
ncbi:hydrolase [Mycobacterium sp. ACS1612]|uniref:alpha/beta fold hydrolase n=1 Tax=Mycobacterium sp. ACS1612 TaxID=1834117 RepID=UPI000800B1D6|nr:alpha/beta hydrolase [Mycobacterium sp. ACS1612]OBF30394.1 hydrolase [Mycobacterium sp. ACS1612]